MTSGFEWPSVALKKLARGSSCPNASSKDLAVHPPWQETTHHHSWLFFLRNYEPFVVRKWQFPFLNWFSKRFVYWLMWLDRAAFVRGSKMPMKWEFEVVNFQTLYDCRFNTMTYRERSPSRSLTQALFQVEAGTNPTRPNFTSADGFCQ